MTDITIKDYAHAPGEDEASVWPTLMFLAATILMTAALLLGVG